MKNDSINRQVAIDALEKKKDKKSQGDIGGFYNKIIQNDIDTLMSLPSTEPKHGYWRKIPMACYGGGTITEYQCSVCEENQITTSNFCPCCGADMREE